ncbi:aldose 1-epimerase [Bacillus cereus group sp. TH152-1LC]|uniref:aldose 1-epimerase n=1 Tax=Bacillus cereus group sp. TH152-1LC TaxID=3018060 RepID=UPI0022E2B369|nr:aldose 1-epimerase [Bacillus cereus group sp. TH152-1LC]MDA1674623.1 aldose 1-epimerase [Bacillus cereus group sp. TH152-1LC]
MNILQITFLDKLAYQIENQHFKAIVLPSQGSNVISLYDKKKNVELLRTPQTKEEYTLRPMLYGIPVLFPPNRIEDATFVYHNQVYNLAMNRAKENNHIHGFVHDKEWDVVVEECTNHKLITRLDSRKHPEILQQFPHEFILEMHVELKDTGLIQTLVVKNHSDKKMPVGLGHHTTFAFPISTSTLQIDVEKQWVLNERYLPTGELQDATYQEELENGMILKDITLDDVYPMTENLAAVIKHPSLGIEISYTATKGYLHWVLFTAGGKDDLLAIEPYSWVTNAPNINLPPELTGLQGLEPGEEKAFVTEINVLHL